MDRKPRPSGVPILGRQMLIWLAIAGLIAGACTLAMIEWGTREYDETVGRTMGLVTFGFFNVAFSLATKDETRSSFNREVIGDRTFLIASLISMAITFLMAEMGMLQRLLGTVGLDAEQWIVCLIVGFSILPIAEVRKLIWKIPVDEVPKGDEASDRSAEAPATA